MIHTMKFYLTISSATLLIFILSSQTLMAEPITDLELIKQYKITLEHAYNEKLNPKKQLANNIKTTDVMCFDNHLPILKLTAENSIACVNPITATKLVERNWGLTHKSNPYEGTSGSECVNYWLIYHDVNMPSSTIMIKTIREITSNFANDFVVWSPIKIEKITDDSITLSSHGMFSSKEISLIKNGLLHIDDILKVKDRPGICS